MTDRRLIIHASQLKEELEKLPINSVIALELPSSGLPADAPIANLVCIAVELRTPSLLVMSPYEMPASDRALFDAIERKDASGCLAAIDAGGDVEARDGRSPLFDYETPLLQAAGTPELVRILLERGADPNARSGSNWTALMRACNAGCLESARLLLEAGADASVLNKEGYSAYGRIPRNQPELLALLEATGNATVRQAFGTTGMHTQEDIAIKSFADVASRVCANLESLAQPPSDGVAEIRLALAELHVAALRLPVVEPGDSTDEAPSDVSQICAARLESLPIDLYWDVFDPLTYEPAAPVANSADDDLRDIYLDLKRGLALYERGAWRDACWSWHFSFTWHWGEHLVGVQRALYLASRNHPE